jgi:hypothetical protein
MKRAKRPAHESAPATRRFTTGKLKAECRSLRADIIEHELATDDECAQFWPGGTRNLMRGQDAWIYAFAQFTRLFGRLEQHQRDGERAARGDALQKAVLRAASRQPVRVELSIGERAVHQKSAHALFVLDSIDATVQPLAEAVLQLADADPDDVRGMIPLTKSLAWRTWAWILLSPGVELPFGDEGAIEPPEWTEQLLPEDFVAIYAAHRELHFEAAGIMGAAFPREEGETSRLSLGGFLAGYASEHGIQPSEMIRRWGLPEALAAAVSSSENYRVAKANAEAKRGRP